MAYTVDLTAELELHLWANVCATNLSAPLASSTVATIFGIGMNWVKDALSKDGVCKIPFKVFYAEEVGYFENFDGCYVEIIKC